MDKRPYRSPLRQEQAAATRQRILAAGLAAVRRARLRGDARSPQIAARSRCRRPRRSMHSVGSKRGIIDALLAPGRHDGHRRQGARGGRGAAAVARGSRSASLPGIAVDFWARHHVLVGVLRNGIGRSGDRRRLDRRASAADVRSSARHPVDLACRDAPSRTRHASEPPTSHGRCRRTRCSTSWSACRAGPSTPTGIG